MRTKVDKYTNKVGMNIKLARTKACLKQEELAEKANLSRDTIGAIERGEKSPTVYTLGRIADALRIDLYKLFVFED